MKIIKKTENGKTVYRLNGKTKLYPICKWEENQHKIYNAYDIAMIYCCEKDWSDDAQAKLELAEKMLEIINGIIINGVVYGTWEQYKLIKDCTAAYDARH